LTERYSTGNKQSSTKVDTCIVNELNKPSGIKSSALSLANSNSEYVIAEPTSASAYNLHSPLLNSLIRSD